MIELHQRSEYTYKFNMNSGRHGWLRLTPAYSLHIVEAIIEQHPEAQCILDPFCGTGTTALCAAYHSRSCVTTDINPFLVWLTKVKTACYTPEDITATREAGQEALALAAQNIVPPYPVPLLFNVERWWQEESLAFLQLLRAAIDFVAPQTSAVHALLLIAFCRTLIALSNADFNHQSMSFRESNQLRLDLDRQYGDVFLNHVHFVLEGAKENPPGSALVAQGDARCISQIVQRTFDLVITSPPYANRISYIRELRPYMYWLGYLDNGRDAGELDWLAIGGTWGIATSRLANWERGNEHFQSKLLDEVLNAINCTGHKNAALLTKYVARYFDDIWAHISDLPNVLARGAKVHYIVGNSSFYGVLVPTEQLYAEMLSALGFKDVACHPIRKRNSKKELLEFAVVAKWL